MRIISLNELTPKQGYCLSILSAILLLLSFPPFEFGMFLGWIVYVPILLAVYFETEVKRVKRMVMIASLGALPVSLGFSWWVLDMLRIVFPQAPIWLKIPVFILGIIVCIVLTRIFVEIITRLWQPKSRPSAIKITRFLPSNLAIIIIPIAFTSIEFIALNIPGLMRITGIYGFFSMAKTQWKNIPILQIASFTGIYGITFLVIIVNCSITLFIIHYKKVKKIYKPSIIIFCLFPFFHLYGFIITPSRSDGSVTIAVLQMPPQGENTYNNYFDLSNESLKYNPDIIILPGLMLDGLIIDEGFINFSSSNNVYITGFVENLGYYGIVSPDGDLKVDNFGYHLATIPNDLISLNILRLFFPKVNSLEFDIGSFAVTDCFESGLPLAARDRVRKGAEILLVPTGSPNVQAFSWLLKTNAIFRAVENHIYTVEVVGDYDSSIIIDPYGRVINDIAPEKNIIVGTISFINQRTFYSTFGDIFGWIIVICFIILVIYNFKIKKKSTFKYCIECESKIEKTAETCNICGSNQERPPLWKRIILHEYYEHKRKKSK